MPFGFEYSSFEIVDKKIYQGKQRDTKPSLDITILPVEYGEEVKSGLTRNRWRSLYRCIKTKIGIHRHRIQTNTTTKKLNTRIQTDQF